MNNSKTGRSYARSEDRLRKTTVRPLLVHPGFYYISLPLFEYISPPFFDYISPPFFDYMSPPVFNYTIVHFLIILSPVL